MAFRILTFCSHLDCYHGNWSVFKSVLTLVFKRKCSSEYYLNVLQDFEQIAFGSHDVSVQEFSV